MGNIYLELSYIRHGEVKSLSDKNLHRQQLYDDASLTASGNREAKEVAQEIVKNIDKEQTVILISSPVKRATQTMSVIKQELIKNGIKIDKDTVLDFLKSARGLDELKHNYSALAGNDLFEGWINGALNVTGLESYIKVKNRFIKFLKYILKMKKPNIKIKVIVVAHAELPDYLMVKFFDKYGLDSGKMFNMFFYENGKILLSIKKRELNKNTFLELGKVADINEILY